MRKNSSIIRIKPGCAAYSLIMMIAVTGEYPVRARDLIGTDNVIRHLISRMTTADQSYIVYSEAGDMIDYAGRLLSVVKPEDAFQYRALRLTKGGRYILSLISSSAYGYFLKENKTTRQSTRDSLMRSCRVAESMAMAALSGCEYRPYILPELQGRERMNLELPLPAFYSSKALARIHQYDSEDISKNSTTSRLTGLLVSANKPYAVYNTLEYVMKWNGNAERRKRASLEYIAAMNWNEKQPIDSCILFGWNTEVILDTFSHHNNIRVRDARITEIYRYIHYVPISDFGAKLLRTLTYTEGREQILEAVFGSHSEPCLCGSVLADIKLGNTYYWSFFDAELTRLFDLRMRILSGGIPENLIVTCYDGQEELVQAVLPKGITIKRLSIDAVIRVIEEVSQ